MDLTKQATIKRFLFSATLDNKTREFAFEIRLSRFFEILDAIQSLSLSSQNSICPRRKMKRTIFTRVRARLPAILCVPPYLLGVAGRGEGCGSPQYPIVRSASLRGIDIESFDRQLGRSGCGLIEARAADDRKRASERGRERTCGRRSEDARPEMPPVRAIICPHHPVPLSPPPRLLVLDPIAAIKTAFHPSPPRLPRNRIRDKAGNNELAVRSDSITRPIDCSMRLDQRSLSAAGSPR